MNTITKGAALRIAMAARAMECVEPKGFTLKLAEQLGLPITEEKLAGITVAALKDILSGEEGVEPDVDLATIKSAMRCLWGESGDEADLPRPQPITADEIAGGLRVAVASNSGENLDGHFGSAPRFLIYQVGREKLKLIDIRPTILADEAEDKNVARAEMINDCQIVYVQSIGGPAAAKVVRAGIHPVKFPTPAPAGQVLRQLQQVLDAPPPWLAKITGVEAKSLVKFTESEQS